MTRAHIALIGGTVAIVLGVFVYITTRPDPSTPTPTAIEAVQPEEVAPTPQKVTSTEIGSSIQGRPITVSQFGNGPTHILFVGGIHGGYEWNSSLLAYDFIDYLNGNPSWIPPEVRISVIPVLNPDGLYRIIPTEERFALADAPKSENPAGIGRFNARDVDLNRNFDCKWQSTSTWRGTPVSAGTAAFSEPEAAALRDYVLATQPNAVIFWHSRANAVYASECTNGILPMTLRIMQEYADAADYDAVPVFDAYPVTGDAEGWLASLGIPAITVELETRTSPEWERNLSGAAALIEMMRIPQTQ